MDAQQIFDTAVKGVLDQGCASTNEYKACVLRGENDTKCAVGHLIPDEAYEANMEESAALSSYSNMNGEFDDESIEVFSAKSVGKAVSSTIGEITSDKMALMYALQTAHDENYDCEQSRTEAFGEVATNFGLSAKVIDDWAAKKEAA